MPLAGCSSPSDPRTEPQRCDSETQACPLAERLTALNVVGGATQSDVVQPSGASNRWAAVKSSSGFVEIEAATEPNIRAVWQRLQWSGDAGQAVAGAENRRRLPRSSSQVLRPTATLHGNSKVLEVWILGATIEILTTGSTPANAAPFVNLAGQPYPDQRLGPVTSEGMTGTVYPGNRYVLNMHTRGRMVAVATLTPAGVNRVVASGWAFRRERFTKQWASGHDGDQTTTGWIDDTSHAENVRLVPDANDKIYDTDGPDIRWGQRSYEIYHNFRQWVEWHSERCSDYGNWHFRAQWQANPDQARQIRLSDVGPAHVALPERPALR